MFETIITGDLFTEIPKIADNSIDAVVTDPPYGIGFMSKEWDTFKPEVKENAFRRAKNPADVGRDNVFGRTSRTSPEYASGISNPFKPGAEAERVVENSDIKSDNPNVRGRKRSPAASPSAVEYNRSLEGQREFQAWTESWARECMRVLKPGGYMLVCRSPALLSPDGERDRRCRV